MSVYDLLIIGAGPAGYSAAFQAAEHGMQVGLIDRQMPPGGTCLYRGCIPSKVLLEIAHRWQWLHRQAATEGIVIEGARLNLEAVRARSQTVIDQLTGGLGQLANAKNVTLIEGEVVGYRQGEIDVQGAQSLQTLIAKQVVLATGSKPIWPASWPDIGSRLWSSDQALELPLIPKSVVVIGGGVIGLELGSVYAAFGSEITILEGLETWLPSVDADVRRAYRSGLGSVAKQLRTSAMVERIEVSAESVQIHLQDGEILQADVAIGAIGRKAVIPTCFVDAGLALGDNGKVMTNAVLQTNLEGVYAIGDITDVPMLAHVGMAQAQVVVDQLNGEPAAFDPYAIPSVIYTDPELAWVGMTEQALNDAGVEFASHRFPWQASGRAKTQGQDKGVSKLLTSDDGRILGASCVGTHAGELISEMALAIEMGATVTDIAQTIHPHPTLAETWRDCAEVALGAPVHVAGRKKR